MKTIINEKKQLIKTRYKTITKPIVKWRRRLKAFQIIKKVFSIIIAVAGPVMSIYLMVDGFINKDKPGKAVQ